MQQEFRGSSFSQKNRSIGCGSGDFFGGVEWISRLRSSKSASTIPNIVVAKPSRVVTKPNIVIVGRCVRGRGRKGS